MGAVLARLSNRQACISSIPVSIPTNLARLGALELAKTGKVPGEPRLRTWRLAT
jgi:hypothetical protein